MEMEEYVKLSSKKNCKDCIYYAESKHFYHPRAKKKIYFSLCKRFRRSRCRAYGLPICGAFEDKEQSHTSMED